MLASGTGPVMESRSLALRLESNSLYIATQTIRSDDSTDDDIVFERDAWHWSFFITDATGVATQHHWNNEANTDFESYQHRRISTVQGRTSYSFYVVFMKVDEWTPLTDDAVLRAVLDALWKTNEGIETTVLRSSNPPRSCRSWIMDALCRFSVEHWLPMLRPSVIMNEIVEASELATDRICEMIDAEDEAGLEGYLPTFLEL